MTPAIAYLQVIVVLHAAFAIAFFFFNRQRPTRFARLFAWCWAIEALRAAILLPPVHTFGGGAFPWFATTDVLCFFANWCLLAGFADLVQVRLPRWLAPVYLGVSIPLVLLIRYALPAILAAGWGVTPERGVFFALLVNLMLMFVPVAVARMTILVWLFRLWRDTHIPGALIAMVFALPYALFALSAPLQHFFSYQPDWGTLVWFVRVLGFSIAVLILVFSQQLAAVRQSEAGLEAAQALAHVGSWVLDPVRGVGSWSREMFRIFARDPQQGAPPFVEFLTTIHPEDRERFQRGEQQAIAEKRSNEVFFRVVLPGRGVRWIHGRSHPVLDAAGALVRLTGTVQDITDRREAEVRIEHLNRVYAVLSDINQMIVRVRDTRQVFAGACQIAIEKGGFLMAWIGEVDVATGRLALVTQAGASPAVQRILDEMLGGNVREPGCSFTARALRTGAHATCHDIARDPEAASWREAALANGYRSMTSCPLRIEGRTIGTFNLYAGETDFFNTDELRLLDELALDIAFAVAMNDREAERMQVEAALHASEERFRQLAETIREVFWLTDPWKKQVLYVSPAYETVWGRSCASLYAAPEGWRESVHPEDRDAVYAAVARQVEGGFDEEYRIIRPEGAVRWIRARSFVVRNAVGDVYRIAGVAEDITERKQVEEQLRQAQKLEAIGQLSGGVAHDFNNLLTVIKGNLAMVPAECSPDADVRQSVAEIASAVDRAAALTGQLLTFSRRQVMQTREVDLGGVVVGLGKMLRRIVGEDVAMEIAAATSPPLWVRADTGMLEQVLLNLVVNARDAMPRGGRLRIATSPEEFSAVIATGPNSARKGAFVCLAVSDTGGGIAPELRARIFEPFFTTKPVGQGTGLGLATVYGIVQQHQGWIEVETAMGLGSTFRVYLPRIPVPTEEASGATAPTGALPGTETILLVEDEAPLREIVSRLLRRVGYKVITAESGVQALERWREQRAHIQVVLTDLVMPGGMSGFDLGEQLAREAPALPVVYTSGYSPEIVGRRVELRPGENFIAKPFGLETVTAALRWALDHGRA